MKKVLMTICLVAVAMAFAGCNTPLGLVFPTGPKGFEWGHVPTGNFDPWPGNLAAFGNKATDGNGIVYTRLAGTLDPDHIWGCGRKTISACKTAVISLEEGKKSFSSNGLTAEVVYPSNWGLLSAFERKNLAREVGLQVGKSIGFHCEIYHELGTWWGKGFNIDYQSSFSWEDLYSDALGAHFAMQGVEKELQGQGWAGKHLTKLTQDFVNQNQWISPGECKKVVKSLKGIAWTSGVAQRSLLWRNVDIGVDGFINNTPIQGFTGPRESLTKVPAPIMDFSNFKGFQIEIWVDSGSQISRAKKLLGVTRINIKDHPQLMQIVGKEMEAKGNTVFY